MPARPELASDPDHNAGQKWPAAASFTLGLCMLHALLTAEISRKPHLVAKKYRIFFKG